MNTLSEHQIDFYLTKYILQNVLPNQFFGYFQKLFQKPKKISELQDDNK